MLGGLHSTVVVMEIAAINWQLVQGVTSPLPTRKLDRLRLQPHFCPLSNVKGNIKCY